MVDNAQKTAFGSSLDQKVRTRVSNLLQMREGRIPATLYQATDNTNTIWMVNFETDQTYTLPMVKMPVHGHQFSRMPYKQGDMGFVSLADVDTCNMTGLGQGNGSSSSGAPTWARPADLASLVWHPLGNTNFQQMLDTTAHESYGRDGGTITHDGTAKSLVKTHATNGTTMTSGATGGASGGGANGPHVINAHPQNGTSITTTAAHILQAKNATLDAQGNQTNQGTHTAQGTITSTTGSVNAPAGSMNAGVSMGAPTGSFTNGSIGGLGFSSGSFGGIATGGAGGLLGGIASGLNGVGSLLGSALAPNAASQNVGTLTTANDTDITGTLANGLRVRALNNVTQANQLPIFANNTQAIAGGLNPGNLYLYNVSAGTYLVAAVV